MGSTVTKIAIVGAGPAAFFATEALLKGSDPVAIDIFDRLPAPYGLVRHGVAPDHEAIKSVARVYEKLLARDEVRYFGAVALGKEITAADLRRCYDQIVYAVGAQSGRRLNVPGEDLAGSCDATTFVGWYNGHPEYRGAVFPLESERVAVVGNGNVALDVARILVSSPDRLARTDIADHALQALRESRVREVVILGRRGPAQASFTNPELREFGRLEGGSAVVEPTELELDSSSRALAGGDRVRSRNMSTLQSFAETPPRAGDRVVRFRFLVSPVAILGDSGRVAAVRLERNRLTDSEDGQSRATGTGEFETLPCGFVLRSVGYRGTSVPGVPFDEHRGIIPNEGGRVLGPDGRAVFGEYVVGWAKRGPTGVIGTNKADSAATVALMAEDRAAGTLVPRGSGETADGARPCMAVLLCDRGIRWVDKAGCQRLHAHEAAAGKAQGRPRVKICSVAEMMTVAGPPTECPPDASSVRPENTPRSQGPAAAARQEPSSGRSSSP